MTALNVLFTSAGRRVELIRAFRRSFQELGLGGRLIGTDIDPLAPALQELDDFFMVPRTAAPDYVPALVQVCKANDISLLFPLTDTDLPVLARGRDALERTGAAIAVLGTHEIDICTDKWLTYEFFRDNDLPTPRTWLPQSHEAPAGAGFPLFVKPRLGSAAAHTHKVEDAEELAFYLRRVPEPVVQEFLPGPEVTTDVVCDMDGELLGIVSRERIEVRSGEVAKGKTVRIPEVETGCATIAERLSVVGPITVQCIASEDRRLFTEINPRFAGGVPLAIAAGADFPTWLLARRAGIDVEIPPVGTYREDLFITRFDDAQILDEEDRSRAQSRHL